MPPRETKPDVVRIVEGVRGRVEMRMELALRFDYGSAVPWVRNLDGALVGIAGPDAVTLRTPVELEGRDFRTYSSFTVSEGDRIPFVLTWFPSHESPPESVDPEAALKDTVTYWEGWASRCSHGGRWHDDIHRSVLTLKALTYAPTGGLVAAPTTSLPEAIGGVHYRNKCGIGLCHKRAHHFGPLGIHRHSNQFKALVLMLLIKSLPAWQLFPAGSPRSPGEKQDPLATIIAQTNFAAIQTLQCKIGREIADFYCSFLCRHRSNGKKGD